VEHLDGQSFDAVIVGAGPAGSSLAIRLANAGKHVLLLEKARFPRHKMCGEFVSPECLDHFDELGVSSAICDVSPPEYQETRFYSRNGRLLAIPNRWLSTSDRNAIGISRFELDNLLMKRARHCGVVVRERSEAVSAVVDAGRLVGLKVRSNGGTISEVQSVAAFDASGRAQSLARHFRSENSAKKPGDVAFKIHASNANVEKGVCEIYSFRGGYGGCSEVENGKFNLCFVLNSDRVRMIGNDRQAILENSVFTNRRAKEVLSDIAVGDGWLTVAIPRFGLSDSCPYPGVFAVGDAAGFIDPFTGSGIALALQTSKLCANSILLENDLEAAAIAYQRNYSATVSNRMRFSGAIRFLAKFPKLADQMIGLFSISPFLSHAAAKATRYNSDR